MNNKSLVKTKTITILTSKGERKYIIAKLPLGKYAQVFEELNRIPGILLKAIELDVDQLLSDLPVIVAKSWLDLIGVISIATGIPKKVLENDVGLDEGIEIISAIIDVNNFFDVAQKGKLLYIKMGGKAAVENLTQVGFKQLSTGDTSKESQKRNS